MVKSCGSSKYQHLMTYKPVVHNADKEQMDTLHFPHISLNVLDPKH